MVEVNNNDNIKNMNEDTLFYVTLEAGTERIMGIVRHESMPEALKYLGREYPNYSVLVIEKCFRQML